VPVFLGGRWRRGICSKGDLKPEKKHQKEKKRITEYLNDIPLLGVIWGGIAFQALVREVQGLSNHPKGGGGDIKRRIEGGPRVLNIHERGVRSSAPERPDGELQGLAGT